MTRDDALPSLVALIRDVTGRAAAAGPLPRGWCHLGLDHATSLSLDQLDGLARQGIFRKYEQVLFLAGGLGAPARWAAAQLGCTAITATASRRAAVLGRGLTRSVGLGDAVLHVAGASDRLPVRDGTVTHVWAVESLGALAHPAAALEEAHRVVRPGGHLAVLEPVSTGERLDVGDRVVEPAAVWIDRVGAAGFVDVASALIDDASDQPSARVAAARAQLDARLVASDVAALRRLAEAQRALTSARAARRVATIRIHARRP